MRGRTFLKQFLATLTRDPAFAYACFAIIPLYLPVELWSPPIHETTQDESLPGRGWGPSHDHRGTGRLGGTLAPGGE
jgi:hypothetical protein